MPIIKKYYPDSEVETGFYANPGEFVLADGTEYIGLYCRASGQLITGARPTKTSEFLFKTDIRHKAERNKRYYTITDRAYDKHVAPEYYLPVPTTQDYQAGNFIRFAAQKINEPLQIIEISPNAASAANSRNRPGINTNIYEIIDIPWSLTGNDAGKYNDKTLQLKDVTFPGIRAYFSDFTEFVK